MIDLGRGVKLVTRAEWGARPPRSSSPLTPSYGTTSHWEGPHMGNFPHSSCATKVQVIQDYHMDSRGWQDIAYTAVTCPHGYVFEGRWVGKRTAANGTTDGNDRAYAVCYLGGEGDPFTEAGKVAQRAALDHLDTHGGAGPGRNCHRDWKPTECPGDTICSWVRAGQPAGTLEDDMSKETVAEGVELAVKSGGRARDDYKSLFIGSAVTGLRPTEGDDDPDAGQGDIREVLRPLLVEAAEEGAEKAVRRVLDELGIGGTSDGG